MTGQRAQGIIAICWVLSILIGLTPMMGWYKTAESNGECPPGLIRCMFENVVVMTYMVYFNFFGCVLIPLLLMLGIYLCIFMVARHQLKLMELKGVRGEKPGSTLQKEIQAAKSLAIIVGLFAVCWLPLHIINCFTLFCPGCARAPELIMYVAIILSHGNSVINPFIYAYRIREFRQTFRKIIHRHILGRRQQLESSSSTRTSVYNTDSIRRTVNGLQMEPSSEPSCGSPCSGPTGDSSVEGCLIAVSHAPLSIIIPRCPHVISGAHRAPKQPRSAAGPPVQQAAEKAEGNMDLGSPRITVLLNEEKSNSCFAELPPMS